MFKSFSLRVLALVTALVFTQAASSRLYASEEKETELGRKMEGIAKAYKELGLQLKPGGTPDPAKCVKLADTIKTNAAAAETMEPARVAEVPEKDRAKFVAAFRKEIAELVGTAGKLEVACSAAKWDDARKIMAELKKEKEGGHKEFKAED